MKAFLLLSAIVLLSQQSLACNWFYTDTDKTELECRVPYKEFFTGNPNAPFNTEDHKRVQDAIQHAERLARGEMEKLVNNSFTARLGEQFFDGITLKQDEKLFNDYSESQRVLELINTSVRRRIADTENFGKEDIADLMPAGFIVGYSFPYNPRFSIAKSSLNPVGGSLFAGVVVLPQKVVMRIKDGELITRDEIDYSVKNILNWMHIEFRPIWAPSLDGKINVARRFKGKKRQKTIGLVFGQNIMHSHQLLGKGASISLPTKWAHEAFKPITPAGDTSKAGQAMINFLNASGKVSNTATNLVPSWLLSKLSPAFDTVKIGIIRPEQRRARALQKGRNHTFGHVTYVWLRMHNDSTLGKKDIVDDATPEGTQADAATDAVRGKARVSGLWVNGVFDDGVADTDTNGLGDDGLLIALNGLAGILNEAQDPDGSTEFSEFDRIQDSIAVIIAEETFDATVKKAILTQIGKGLKTNPALTEEQRQELTKAIRDALKQIATSRI